MPKYKKRTRKKKEQPKEIISTEGMSRREITHLLTDKAVFYLARKRMSAHLELGVVRKGRRRVDIMAMSFKRKFTIIEVKSGLKDLEEDNGKWISYLEFAHKFYFCFDHATWNKHKRYISKHVKEHGAGVMVLEDKIRVRIRAKERTVDPSTVLWNLTKMAFRGGAHIPKRKRKVVNY
jgi:hypothetical protein